MKKSELRQIIKEEMIALSESAITTIPNLNVESNVAIIMLKLLKNDNKFKKISIAAGLKFFGGVSPTTVYKILHNAISKAHIITDKLISNVSIQLKNKKFDEVITVNSPNVITQLLSKILAQGMLFDMRENPIQFAKSIGDKKLIDAANEFSANRGKGKFKTMMKNRG